MLLYKNIKKNLDKNIVSFLYTFPAHSARSPERFGFGRFVRFVCAVVRGSFPFRYEPPPVGGIGPRPGPGDVLQ